MEKLPNVTVSSLSELGEGKGDRQGRQSPSPSRPFHRPLSRTATLPDGRLISGQRRSSMFSDSVSDTRKSLRSSTDDLLLPRVSENGKFDYGSDPSHWHSVPLGLALLPAVGGLLFQDGSALVTDIMLLGLAAIFLNWSVRLPW